MLERGQKRSPHVAPVHVAIEVDVEAEPDRQDLEGARAQELCEPQEEDGQYGSGHRHDDHGSDDTKNALHDPWSTCRGTFLSDPAATHHPYECKGDENTKKANHEHEVAWQYDETDDHEGDEAEVGGEKQSFKYQVPRLGKEVLDCTKQREGAHKGNGDEVAATVRLDHC